MVVEQKFKVLQKAEKEIYQNEFQGIRALQPLLSILQPLRVSGCKMLNNGRRTKIQSSVES